MGQQALRQTVTAFAALHDLTLLTCADWVRHGLLAVAFRVAKGLLMRFGFAPIRGSNPRASANDQPLPISGVVAASFSVIIFISR